MIALAFWLVPLAPVLTHWVTPTVGVSLVLTVSTQSLAVLSAALAASERADWLLYTALTPFLLGLGFYVFVISRFDFRQLAVGRGDHWIRGGALAISTLAAGRITLAAKAPHQLGGVAGTLKVVSLVLWGLTIAWLPVLLAAELLTPRLRYDVRRWSTVFPLGMYAACSLRRRRPGHRHGDHRLRTRLGVGQRRRMARRVRGNAPPRRGARPRRAPAAQPEAR